MHNILIRKVAHEAEARRRSLKSALGERYETLLGPYRSLIVKEMRQRRCAAVEAAATLISVTLPNKKPHPKLEPLLAKAGIKDGEFFKNIFFAAALDVVERRLDESAPKPQFKDTGIKVEFEDEKPGSDQISGAQ